MSVIYYETSADLCHYGIKGMKWGVRRFQNKDGSLTSAGRKRKNLDVSDDSSIKRTRSIGKKVAAGTIATASVAAAAYYVHKHPEAIGKVVSKFRGAKFNDVKSKAVDSGKKYVKNAIDNAKDSIKKAPSSIAKGVKEGFDEAIREAPKKITKTLVTGAALVGTKKALDATVGKEESAMIFQANDNKKIGKFWKTGPEDRDD